MKHLVFYDGSCGLCDHVVEFLLKHDKKSVFLFAPLQGKTASIELQYLPDEMKGEDSLILIENYNVPGEKFYMLGKGAFRILWLMGGLWSVLGIINFFPDYLYNWGYRLVARKRHKLFKQDVCRLPNENYKGRFLE